jgi:hypothetical protein
MGRWLVLTQFFIVIQLLDGKKLSDIRHQVIFNDASRREVYFG